MDRTDVIRKLVETARSLEVDNPDASQSYLDKAVALAAKYGIEDALNPAPVADKVILHSVWLDNPYRKHRATLLHVIAKNLNCVVYYNRQTADIFGNKTDVDQAVFVYNLVLPHMLHGAGAARPFTSGWGNHYYFKGGLTPGEVKSFRIAWISGYINGISARMKAAYATAVQEAKSAGNTGAEIVLADRKAVVQKFAEQTYPNSRKSSPTKVRSRQAYAQGKARSVSADLGQTRIGGSRTALR